MVLMVDKSDNDFDLHLIAFMPDKNFIAALFSSLLI